MISKHQLEERCSSNVKNSLVVFAIKKREVVSNVTFKIAQELGM
jgi:hypothetical protein